MRFIYWNIRIEVDKNDYDKYITYQFSFLYLSIINKNSASVREKILPRASVLESFQEVNKTTYNRIKIVMVYLSQAPAYLRVSRRSSERPTTASRSLYFISSKGQRTWEFPGGQQNDLQQHQGRYTLSLPRSSVLESFQEVIKTTYNSKVVMVYLSQGPAYLRVSRRSTNRPTTESRSLYFISSKVSFGFMSSFVNSHLSRAYYLWTNSSI